jgi:integral membrane sensor domain MASE1
MTSIAIGTARMAAERATQTRRLVGQLGIGLAVLLIYVAAGKVGFHFAFVAEQVTTVWAPTGSAIACVLLCGPRLWPAIWLGAFLVNADTAAPPWTAFFVATGNTLDAIVAGFALRRIASFDFGLTRVADVLAFVGTDVVGGTIISATVGTATLCAAGVQPWGRFAAVWSDWWLGDALGALIVAPPI